MLQTRREPQRGGRARVERSKLTSNKPAVLGTPCAAQGRVYGPGGLPASLPGVWCILQPGASRAARPSPAVPCPPAFLNSAAQQHQRSACPPTNSARHPARRAHLESLTGHQLLLLLGSQLGEVQPSAAAGHRPRAVDAPHLQPLRLHRRRRCGRCGVGLCGRCSRQHGKCRVAVALDRGLLASCALALGPPAVAAAVLVLLLVLRVVVLKSGRGVECERRAGEEPSCRARSTSSPPTTRSRAPPRPHLLVALRLHPLHALGARQKSRHEAGHKARVERELRTGSGWWCVRGGSDALQGPPRALGSSRNSTHPSWEGERSRKTCCSASCLGHRFHQLLVLRCLRGNLLRGHGSLASVSKLRLRGHLGLSLGLSHRRGLVFCGHFVRHWLARSQNKARSRASTAQALSSVNVSDPGEVLESAMPPQLPSICRVTVGVASSADQPRI